MDTCVFEDIEQKWHSELWNDLCRNGWENKSRTYRTFKTDFSEKSYLSMNIKLSKRRALASLRCGVAPLHIETGRYSQLSVDEMKWNESGFRPLLCTYRLNWARKTSWGWWDDWDDTALQTQDSKFEPWRSEAEHATSRSRRLPTILTFTRGWGRNIFVSFKPPRPGTEPRTLAWKAAVLTTTLGPPPYLSTKESV